MTWRCRMQWPYRWDAFDSLQMVGPGCKEQKTAWLVACMPPSTRLAWVVKHIQDRQEDNTESIVSHQLASVRAKSEKRHRRSCRLGDLGSSGAKMKEKFAHRPANRHPISRAVLLRKIQIHLFSAIPDWVCDDVGRVRCVEHRDDVPTGYIVGHVDGDPTGYTIERGDACLAYFSVIPDLCVAWAGFSRMKFLSFLVDVGRFVLGLFVLDVAMVDLC
jgi:hypothetical protein